MLASTSADALSMTLASFVWRDEEPGWTWGPLDSRGGPIPPLRMEKVNTLTVYSKVKGHVCKTLAHTKRSEKLAIVSIYRIPSVPGALHFCHMGPSVNESWVMTAAASVSPVPQSIGTVRGRQPRTRPPPGRIQV